MGWETVAWLSLAGFVVLLFYALCSLARWSLNSVDQVFDDVMLELQGMPAPLPTELPKCLTDAA